jgi:hypothetical protein
VTPRKIACFRKIHTDSASKEGRVDITHPCNVLFDVSDGIERGAVIA